ncbi:hypothetical protein OAQ84_01960 [Bdellovibrionales bacterium]|nr:hypothetical protein [Bdellovibrionales bacterium]
MKDIIKRALVIGLGIFVTTNSGASVKSDGLILQDLEDDSEVVGQALYELLEKFNAMSERSKMLVLSGHITNALKENPLSVMNRLSDSEIVKFEDFFEQYVAMRDNDPLKFCE